MSTSSILPTKPIERAYATVLGHTYSVTFPPIDISLGQYCTTEGILVGLAMTRAAIAELYAHWEKDPEVVFDYEAAATFRAGLERSFGPTP